MPSLTTRAQQIADAYKPPAIGRHSDLGDAETVANFLHALADGNYLDTAAAIAGVHRATVYRWLKQAETCTDPNHPAVRLRDAIKNAESMAEAEHVANMRAAGRLPQFWAASATYLERKYPDRWGKRPETDAGPRVIVQIGVSAEHVVTVANPVNVMATYQTQTESESVSAQSLTDTVSGDIQAKVTGESVLSSTAKYAEAEAERAQPGSDGKEIP